ncbi:hypothetical protein ABZS76_22115 [Streptomyces sp. NPDC005562]|uniref:hypothetical protein n=1 Tax=Streptomyces sp. NPDC005562 TaxID=3154890 RepID=UPI0033A51E20
MSIRVGEGAAGTGTGAGTVPKALPAHVIEVGNEPLAGPARNSVGGWPYLGADEDDGGGTGRGTPTRTGRETGTDPGTDPGTAPGADPGTAPRTAAAPAPAHPWPACFCGRRMALFFQLDVPPDIAYFGGDHLLVFHCRTHNDASDPDVTDGRLAPRFWDAPQPHYPSPFWRVLLLPAPELPAGTKPAPDPDAEPSLRPLPLTLRPFEDTPDPYGCGAQVFKVGGIPSWAQSPERYRCGCGAELSYLCQVPEGMEFGDETDALFLGNEIYLLACPDHCDPAAVWPVNQN